MFRDGMLPGHFLYGIREMAILCFLLCYSGNIVVVHNALNCCCIHSKYVQILPNGIQYSLTDSKSMQKMDYLDVDCIMGRVNISIIGCEWDSMFILFCLSLSILITPKAFFEWDFP